MALLLTDFEAEDLVAPSPKALGIAMALLSDIPGTLPVDICLDAQGGIALYYGLDDKLFWLYVMNNGSCGVQRLSPPKL